MTEDKRVNWDVYFMGLAEAAMVRANCSRRMVGAILVRDHDVVALGYNGTPAGTPNCFEGGCERCADDWPSGERYDLCMCLSYNSRILLANGKWEKIGKLVHQKSEELVRSYDITAGEFVDKPITGWYKFPFSGEWRRVETQYGRRGRHGYLGGTFTPDHELLLDKGWYPISQIEPGMKIATNEALLSYEEEQLVYGSLLGDASIKKTGSGEFIVSHTSKHRDYVIFKQEIFHTTVARITDSPFRKSKNPSGEGFISGSMTKLRTENRMQFRTIRERVYPNDHKTISTSWLDKVDSLGLMFWFLDDGSLYNKYNAVFAVCGYSATEIQLLRDWLKTRFGLETTLVKGGDRLYLRRLDSDRFFELIYKHVPLVMQYKLPLTWRGKFESIPSTPSPGAFFNTITAVREVSLPDFYRNWSFCIDVEDTNNFVTLSGVAHNCVHAEINSILMAARQGLSTKNTTMYTTIAPCMSCIKEIIQAGVVSIIHGGSVVPVGVTAYQSGMIYNSNLRIYELVDGTPVLDWAYGKW